MDDVAHLFAAGVVNEVVVAQEDVVGLEKMEGDEPGREAADTVALAHIVVNEAALDRSVNMVDEQQKLDIFVMEFGHEVA